MTLGSMTSNFGVYCLEITSLKTTIFFWESFNLWCPLLMIVLYHQTKTPISFWCRREFLRSLIQPSETLPVELTGTYLKNYNLICIIYRVINRIVLHKNTMKLYTRNRTCECDWLVGRKELKRNREAREKKDWCLFWLGRRWEWEN